jgi:hypothetical protein
VAAEILENDKVILALSDAVGGVIQSDAVKVMTLERQDERLRKLEEIRDRYSEGKAIKIPQDPNFQLDIAEDLLDLGLYGKLAEVLTVRNSTGQVFQF